MLGNYHKDTKWDEWTDCLFTAQLALHLLSQPPVRLRQETATSLPNQEHGPSPNYYNEIDHAHRWWFKQSVDADWSQLS